MASRLLLAFAALIVPLALFSGWSNQRALNQRRDDAIDEQIQLTRTAGTVLESLLRDFDTTMLITSKAISGQQQPLNQETIGPLVLTLAQRYPLVRAVFVMGPDGRVAASPSGQTIGMDLSEQPYARALMNGDDFILTGAIPGVETGHPLVVMARAVRDDNHALRGMIAFAFYPERLSELFHTQLAPDTLLNVLDGSGALLFTSSTRDIAPEERGLFRDLPIVRSALAGAVASTASSISPIDGQERIGTAAPVEEYGWVVLVSRTTAAIQRPLEESFRREILALGAVTTVALALAWAISQALVLPLERLARRARDFGHGNLSEPATIDGPPEVRALAEALNAMAVELQERLDERESALDEARAALTVRDQFLSVAAHELRTPLTALKGQVQIARRRLATGAAPSDLDALLGRADSQVDRLSDLISDLLDVTRISTGRLSIEKEPVAPAPMIRRIVELERAMAPHRAIGLLMPETLPVIEADPARLEQVLFNLLENAVKYSPDDAPIEVRAGAAGDRLEIAVRDHGDGIDPDEQTFIFERFQRGSNIDQNVSGLGLGLYISREIIEAHDGQVSVLSQPGEGSTFAISLPIPVITIDPDLVDASIPVDS
jgi:signal transduction histidine kinase